MKKNIWINDALVLAAVATVDIAYREKAVYSHCKLDKAHFRKIPIDVRSSSVVLFVPCFWLTFAKLKII